MREAPLPGKSVMRTNFATPKSSGHESTLTTIWAATACLDLRKFKKHKKQGGGREKKKKKRKPQPVIPYFLYRYFDCALQTPGRAFLNCPGIWRLNWASETPDCLSPFWGQNVSTQPSSVAQSALVSQSFDKTCRTVGHRAGREVFFYCYC